MKNTDFTEAVKQFTNQITTKMIAIIFRGKEESDFQSCHNVLFGMTSCGCQKIMRHEKNSVSMAHIWEKGYP